MLASDSGGAMDLNIESVPVDELAWRAVNSGEIDPSMVRVDADRNTVAFVDNQRIQHALNCLLGNAIRYGGSNIELVVGSDQSTLVLEVHDDGPGVPRKYELVIWEKFSRGPNHLNATVPGSGIGLAITRDIATAHGGLTGYRRSERLGGACFWIRLPARAQNTARPQPIAASQSGDALSA
jgi:K+-sensing histidine kinase KdpD